MTVLNNKTREGSTLETSDGGNGVPQTSAGPERRTALVPRVLARWSGVRLSGLALPALLLFFILFFSLVRTSTFWTIGNFRTVLSSQAVLAIVALGAMLPLAVGEFDLSVASNLGLGAIVATGLTANVGMPTGLAIVLALVTCTFIGIVNGVLVSVMRINAFVATLAVGTVIGGVSDWVTGGSAIANNIPQSLISIGNTDVGWVPITAIYVVVIGAVLYYALRFTPPGRYLYAVGSSKEAARLIGLNVRRTTLMAFVFAGLIAGIAGVMEAGVLGSASPTVGPEFLLPAFAACFLGATSIKPGTFNVIGTVIAVYTIAFGTVGLELMGVPSYI